MHNRYMGMDICDAQLQDMARADLVYGPVSALPQMYLT